MGKLVNLQPGQRVCGIPGETWNAHNRATQIVERTLGTSAGSGQQAGFDNQLRVQVKNLTGSDQDQFAIVSLATPVFDVTDDASVMRRGVTLEGDSPLNTVAAFGVLQGSAPANGYAAACVRGLTWVKVDKQTASDSKCGVVTGTTTHLKGGLEGASIVWSESGTGVKWAIVQLGESEGAIAHGVNAYAIYSVNFDSSVTLGDASHPKTATLTSSGGDVGVSFDNGTFTFDVAGDYEVFWKIQAHSVYADAWLPNPAGDNGDLKAWALDFELQSLFTTLSKDTKHYNNFAMANPIGSVTLWGHDAREFEAGTPLTARLASFPKSLGAWGEWGSWTVTESDVLIKRLDSLVEQPPAAPAGDGDLLLEDGASRLLLESGGDIRIDVP